MDIQRHLKTSIGEAAMGREGAIALSPFVASQRDPLPFP